MTYSGSQAGSRSAKGLLGRLRPGERLAVLVYSHGGQTCMELNTKSYLIVIYSVCKTILFGEELN